ncbi:MAG TPA: ATP-binding protein [Opitutaceae bacterium]|nr:ATP-binding protein [Opitutaceae bacterium]
MSASRSDLTKLSKSELEDALRILQGSGPAASEAADKLQAVVHELMVHRYELEMQNRALHEAQGELEDSLVRYTDLYDSLPIAYVSLNSQGLIGEANLAAAELLNISRKFLIGHPIRTFVFPPDQQKLTELIMACHATENKFVAELRLVPKGGNPISVQMSGKLNYANPVGLAPIVRVAITDISELKRTQKSLEEINSEQESFCYSISHDLRAPLITISNFSSVIRKDFSQQLNGEGIDLLDRVQRAAVRMDQQLKELLAYSRLSRAELVMEPLNLDEVIRNLLVQHEGFIREHHAQVDVQRPLPSVYASQEPLTQALSNLLTNAIKYTPPDASAQVSIYAQKTGAKVVITVQDQGSGIAPQYHDRIFGLFERLHGQTIIPGSGVGLAIVKRAAERMSGRVWLESHEGEGSRFYLELPSA